MLKEYSLKLQSTLRESDWGVVESFCEELGRCWTEGRQFFICGNGGSAGNAIHMANDFTYGIAPPGGVGMRVHALPSNSAVLTCLANDTGYENIFSIQLAAYGKEGDVLLVLSGSGNSPNIVKALETARAKKIRSWALLGYDGGKCLSLADRAIHFPVNDMQIAEDMQLIVGHMAMKWLKQKGLS